MGQWYIDIILHYKTVVEEEKSKKKKGERERLFCYLEKGKRKVLTDQC